MLQVLVITQAWHMVPEGECECVHMAPEGECVHMAPEGECVHMAPEGECVYIRKRTSACVITNKLHFWNSKNLPKPEFDCSASLQL